MSTDPIRSVLRRALSLDPPSRLEAQLHDHAMRVVGGEVEPRRRPLSLRVVAVSVVALALVAGGAVKVVQDRAHHLRTPAPATTPSLPALPSPSVPAVVAPPSVPAPSPTPVRPSGTRQVLDLSWVSLSEGWALVSQECGASSCERVLHTTDGVHWSDTGPVPAGAGSCTSNGPCITRIRFAGSRIGYLFGNLLLLTTDGGHTWHPGTGLTNALEIAGGTAVRITAPLPGDGGLGRQFSVEESAIGTDAWHTILAHVPGPGGPPLLQRDGSQRLYVTSTGNSAGGAMSYNSPIATSADGGRTWSQITDPCSSVSTDQLVVAMAAAPPGRLVVNCSIRSGGATPYGLRISTDAGASFGPRQVLPAWATPFHPTLLTMVTGNGTLVALGVDNHPDGSASVPFIETSRDQARSWQKVADLQAFPNGAVAGPWVGFQDATTGRVADGDRLYTTHDGGATWVATPI